MTVQVLHESVNLLTHPEEHTLGFEIKSAYRKEVRTLTLHMDYYKDLLFSEHSSTDLMVDARKVCAENNIPARLALRKNEYGHNLQISFI